MTTTYQKINSSRLLPERSRIEFHYGGDQEEIIFLPFYENPKIHESQSSNYAEYNPVGRAGSLYAYLGAKSRKFKIDMTYTIPHLEQHEMGISRFLRIFDKTSPEAERNAFYKNNGQSLTAPADPNHSLGTACVKLYYHMFADKLGISIFDDPWEDKERLEGSYLARPPPGRLGKIDWNDFQRNIDLQSGIGPDSILARPGSSWSEHTGSRRYDAIDTLLFFMAVLRTSVTNNATDPMIGPPLLRLSFGSMYQNVPCLCKDYNISWEEDGGYDLETLTPRNLNIKLSLEEVRVGDFGEYVPAKFVKNDNLTGWESAINSPYTTDPLPVEGYWVDT